MHFANCWGTRRLQIPHPVRIGAWRKRQPDVWLRLIHLWMVDFSYENGCFFFLSFWSISLSTFTQHRRETVSKGKKNLLWVSMIECTTLCNMAVQKYLEVHTVMECLGLTTAQHLYSYEWEREWCGYIPTTMHPARFVWFSVKVRRMPVYATTSIYLSTSIYLNMQSVLFPLITKKSVCDTFWIASGSLGTKALEASLAN